MTRSQFYSKRLFIDYLKQTNPPIVLSLTLRGFSQSLLLYVSLRCMVHTEISQQLINGLWWDVVHVLFRVVQSGSEST